MRLRDFLCIYKQFGFLFCELHVHKKVQFQAVHIFPFIYELFDIKESGVFFCSLNFFHFFLVRYLSFNLVYAVFILHSYFNFYVAIFFPIQLLSFVACLERFSLIQNYMRVCTHAHVFLFFVSLIYI